MRSGGMQQGSYFLVSFSSISNITTDLSKLATHIFRNEMAIDYRASFWDDTA